MDWNLLKSSSSDLPRLLGSPLRPSIPLSEIETHTTRNECWIILKGTVYNISSYLAYHPGGEKIIEKFGGKDCTDEFDKYHSWVNIEGLVGVLKVGYVEKIKL